MSRTSGFCPGGRVPTLARGETPWEELVHCSSEMALPDELMV